jgi:predicted nuclease with RNAse H fold
LRFVGCALAWRPGEAREKVSCLVVMDERGSIIANSFAASAEDIARAVKGYVEDRRGVLVGIDAPLAVPNERGTRRIERVLSKVALPAYSASRKMFGGEPYSEELLSELEKIGVEYTDYPFPREREQSVAVEVDSAATLKNLSLERSGAADNGDLAQRLRNLEDPKFRKGNKESRAAGLRGAIEILWDTPGLRLRTGNLSADISAPANVDVSKLDVSAEMSHAELDRTVSLVEGTLSAYTVHRHWRGRDGSMVVGAGDEGSVLLPVGTALRDRLAEECTTATVPYV